MTTASGANREEKQSRRKKPPKTETAGPASLPKALQPSCVPGNPFAWTSLKAPLPQVGSPGEVYTVFQEIFKEAFKP